MKSLYFPTLLLLCAMLSACGVSEDDSSTKITSFTVSTQVEGQGSVTPNNAIVDSGQTAMFTLLPDLGFEISSVTGCDGQLHDSTYITAKINGDCELKVSFVSIKWHAPRSLQSMVYSIEADESVSVQLSWQPIDIDVQFNVYLAEESFASLDDIANYSSLKGAQRVGALTGGSYTFTGLKLDTHYYAVITAQDSVNESLPSNELNIITTMAAPVVASFPLNDTGITFCDDYAFDGGSHSSRLDCSLTADTDGDPVPKGQDGHYGRDVTHNNNNDGYAGFSFTKLDDKGEALDSSASHWSCVKDNVTGLIWEVKTNDEGLQGNFNNYTWHNPDSSTNGGNEGVQNGGSCTGSDCDTYAYVNAINTLNGEQGLCGASDWRLPNREELRSIVDYSRNTPSIDLNYFPHTLPSHYWTSMSGVELNDYASRFNFDSGFNAISPKYDAKHVRLVRTAQ